MSAPGRRGPDSRSCWRCSPFRLDDGLGTADGGLWIGLPLAVAAIVLGVRARRFQSGTVMATVAIGIATLVIAQMAVWFIVAALD